MIRELKRSKKIIMSENKKYLFSYIDKTVTCYDAETYKEIIEINFQSIVSKIAVSHNSKMLAVKTLVGDIYVYKIKDFIKICEFRCEETRATQTFDMIFSKDNKKIIDLVLSNNNLGYISIRDIKTAKEVVYFQGKSSIFETIKYLKSKDNYFITGLDKLNLKKKNRYFYAFLDLEKEEFKKINLKHQIKKTAYAENINKTFNLGIGIDENKIFKFNSRIYKIEGVIKDINVSNKGDKLLVYNENLITLFDTKKFNMLKKFEMEDINYIDFSKEDTKLYMCSDKETVIYEL